MICWMAEGTTARAELPSGMDHATARSSSKTQIPLLIVFIMITTSKEYVRLDAVYVLIVCQPGGETAKRKGKVCSKEGAWPGPLKSAGTQPFCGFPRQTWRLYPAATPG